MQQVGGMTHEIWRNIRVSMSPVLLSKVRALHCVTRVRTHGIRCQHLSGCKSRDPRVHNANKLGNLIITDSTSGLDAKHGLQNAAEVSVQVGTSLGTHADLAA